MSKLKIVTESLPSRCEICHQTDCFDASLNHCARCSEIKVEMVIDKPARDLRKLENYTLLGGTIGFFISLISTGLTLNAKGIGEINTYLFSIITLFTSCSIGALSGALISGISSLLSLLAKKLK